MGSFTRANLRCWTHYFKLWCKQINKPNRGKRNTKSKVKMGLEKHCSFIFSHENQEGFTTSINNMYTWKIKTAYWQKRSMQKIFKTPTVTYFSMERSCNLYADCSSILKLNCHSLPLDGLWREILLFMWCRSQTVIVLARKRIGLARHCPSLGYLQVNQFDTVQIIQ